MICRYSYCNRLVPRVIDSSRQVSSLSFEKFGDNTKACFFMHGILGHKRNWRTPAQVWMKQHPSFSCVTIDHRGHGASPNMTGPNTVASCAADFSSLIAAEVRKLEVNMILAHSFGGKVALQYLNDQCENGSRLPKHTWILDSIPRPYVKHDDTTPSNQSVFHVFDILNTLPKYFESREWAVERLVEAGLHRAIALWLATNIVSSPPEIVVDGKKKYCFGFDLNTIKELFDDFCEKDMWEFLRSYDGEEHIHFIRAGKNSMWTANILNDFSALTAKNKKIKLHTMEHVGHWLHTEDLNGMFQLISKESGLLSPK